MLFNSIEFALFLPLVFFVYWFIFNKKLNHQNLFILIASYAFYGWWDYRFLALIFLSSIIDYSIGLFIFKTSCSKKRKMLLGISLLANLGMLGFFKYFNFFIENFIDAFSLMGINLQANTLKIILPVGISFYTFQTLSYTIDIYRNRLKPTNNIISFFAFVSFFPQLVAGPIERASNLLPQFNTARIFNIAQAKDGLKQISWGLFKKIVIADTCAHFVDHIFQNYGSLSSGVLILGAVFFAFQIYGDFSGYSDIAIGTAKLFGFKLMINFKYPYFSRDIAEFWRRWHISLSTWFRDYVYIPLGGSFGSNLNKIRNVLIIFIVSGFWHGANWTFIAWGLLNAIYFLPLILTGKHKTHIAYQNTEKRLLANFSLLFKILFTFSLTSFAWIFFRSENIIDAFNYIGRIGSFDSFNIPAAYTEGIFLILVLLAFEWPKKNKEHPLQFDKSGKVVRFITNTFIIYMIIAYVSNEANEFIYFQF